MKKYLLLLFILALKNPLKAQTGINQDTTVYTKVDTEPGFPGGETQLYAFIGKNVRYPLSSRRNFTQGTVLITFVVERDGTLSNFKIKSSPDKAMGEESLRAARKLPKFVPGTLGHIPVRSLYTMPAVFTLGRQ